MQQVCLKSWLVLAKFLLISLIYLFNGQFHDISFILFQNMQLLIKVLLTEIHLQKVIPDAI